MKFVNAVFIFATIVQPRPQGFFPRLGKGLKVPMK